MITIRDASENDVNRLLEIYSYYVEKTAISFEITVPSQEEFKSRMKLFKEHYPYLVIEEDGRIKGYAYAHQFIGREAYAHSCETTIYIDHGSHKKGFGRMLYEELEKRLKQIGIINLYACIGIPAKEDEYLTDNSMNFHAHIGYKTVGTFNNCGRKFGRWYSMVWMEKLIGDHI